MNLKECPPDEKRQRILKIIEGLSFMEYVGMDTIYKLSHLGVGNCKHNHDEWLQEAEEIEIMLKKNKKI